MERKKMKKIILVFKTHFDIGFTDLSSRVIDNYAKGMLEEVIETCEKTRDMGKLRYVWTMPAWPLLHIVQNCAPELKEKLKRAGGRFRRAGISAGESGFGGELRAAAALKSKEKAT